MNDKKKPFVTPTNAEPKSIVNSLIKPDAEMHILVGGPYTKDGEEHRYGHTALRIKTARYDLTYDFGRYGQETGLFGESGEGILRVWTSFSAYINGENFLKRKTTGFIYDVFSNQTNLSKNFFDEAIKKSTKFGGSNSTRTAYKLSTDYHALGPNCTTLSLDGARQAVPRIDEGSEKFIKPEAVLNGKELFALKMSGNAKRLFLPANLLDFLNRGYPIKVNRMVVHGG